MERKGNVSRVEHYMKDFFPFFWFEASGVALRVIKICKHNYCFQQKFHFGNII